MHTPTHSSSAHSRKGHRSQEQQCTHRRRNAAAIPGQSRLRTAKLLTASASSFATFSALAFALEAVCSAFFAPSPLPSHLHCSSTSFGFPGVCFFGHNRPRTSLLMGSSRVPLNVLGRTADDGTCVLGSPRCRCRGHTLCRRRNYSCRFSGTERDGWAAHSHRTPQAPRWF
ncbi:hypothetical protein DQ04_23421000 [Trypanosoma grayi]|uniref:hypothetical protein n=1 Tax=Trypanosoma grayi TaxID=71804 RepID=UPI0004F4987F|nr:hypothetical protein DQ04_23421000 [Trypanosoma grayi]KEG05331.1 hypothetical protein DQ04_23421000 [Trypanosoma grayi]